MSKIVNVYTVWDLDTRPRNPNNNFKSKNCLFGATNTVWNSDEEKYVYSRNWITFDRAGSWGFDDNLARNAIFFDVDNSSSSHVDNHKNNFSVLGEFWTYGINGSFGSAEKKFTINYATSKFSLRLHYNADNSYLFVNVKEIFKSTADNKNGNFPTRFCFESITKGFRATESREVSLNGNVHDILNIHKYLMNKNKIK